MDYGAKHESMGGIGAISPGLESVWAGEGDKEVVVGTTASTAVPIHTRVTPPEKKPARVCGLRRIVFWPLLAATFAIVIGLAVGLGVGLGVKHKAKKPASTSAKTSDYYIGGALDPAYYSKQGAFNGSGLALASQSFGSGEYGELVLYFQHHSGSIRWQRLTPDNGWLGGTASEVVATDAKNSTPLSAVAYSLNGWHLFYIDNSNRLREKINSNATNLWIEGPLTGENHTVLNADQVGMQACWYGNDYGDADYKHSPLPNQGNSTVNSTTGSSADVGMHLWYASDASTFQQLGWRNGDSNWTYQQEWSDKNGHAGLGCYSWGPGTTTYVMMVNKDNVAEIWWKDTNTNTSSSANHPINQWTNSSVAINNVHPSSSLGYTNAFYTQGTDDWITGHNISWASENTTIQSSFPVNNPGIPGTHMSVTTLPDQSGGDSLCVFYQTTGSDVTFATRDLVQGAWTAATLKVPDS
ncbi:unnamed protein product [Aureobasidium vineae]|uniref:Fucose-specific lectin n=1 Tax=Aureobasidium vineae TaxID=2773715 RepID=A0A9N8JK72_9PEZI|nr:unnamed protein product [Aureobasidium vineae]